MYFLSLAVTTMTLTLSIFEGRCKRKNRLTYAMLFKGRLADEIKFM